MGKALKDQAQGLGVDLWDLSWLAGEGGGAGSPGLPKDHQEFSLSNLSLGVCHVPDPRDAETVK